MTECISEGLYRIPVPLPGNPLRELNSYLLRGRERSLLIDTGFRQEEGRRALFAGLAELDVDPRDVDVALTHLHSDHSGLAPEVVGETGWIYVSGPDRAYLEQPEEAKWAHTDAFYISEGFPPELLAQNRANPARALAPVPTGRYRTLEPGAVLEAGGRRLTCLPAPGHTPGQLCFWDESDGILFTGDHVLFDISPNITPWNGMEDALGCYLDSLRAVRELPARLALPGHRRPGALAPRVDALLEHHARRLDELTAILRARPGSTAYEAAAHMTWNIRSRSCRGRVHRPPGPSAPAGTAPARAAGRCVACLGPLTASAGRQRYIFLFFIFSFILFLMFFPKPTQFTSILSICIIIPLFSQTRPAKNGAHRNPPWGKAMSGFTESNKFVTKGDALLCLALTSPWFPAPVRP